MVYFIWVYVCCLICLLCFCWFSTYVAGFVYLRFVLRLGWIGLVVMVTIYLLGCFYGGLLFVCLCFDFVFYVLIVLFVDVALFWYLVLIVLGVILFTFCFITF